MCFFDMHFRSVFFSDRRMVGRSDGFECRIYHIVRKLLERDQATNKSSEFFHVHKFFISEAPEGPSPT